MEPISFECTVCHEPHFKYLPPGTNRTTCNRCKNLIDISNYVSNTRYQNQQRRSHNYNNYEDEYYDNSFDENNYDPLDFNTMSGHDDYLPSLINNNVNFNSRRNNNNNRPHRNNNHNNYNLNEISEDSFEDEPLEYYSNIGRRGINNNNNRNNNRNRNNSNNRNNNNNANSGMFQISVPNDNYNRYSAWRHRIQNPMFGADEDLEDEIDYEIRHMNLNNNNNNRNSNNYINNNIFNFNREIINYENNLLNRVLQESLKIVEQKPKITLKKQKMNKNLVNSNDKDEKENPTCCICLVVMKINEDVTKLKCGHLFHFKCLDKWIETKEVCPFCRMKIEEEKNDKKNEKKKKNSIKNTNTNNNSNTNTNNNNNNNNNNNSNNNNNNNNNNSNNNNNNNNNNNKKLLKKKSTKNISKKK